MNACKALLITSCLLPWKPLKRALLIFLIGASVVCPASPASSFFSAHQQTMLFTAGSFVGPCIAANAALLIAQKASPKSAAYALLITGLPCAATIFARFALERWTKLPHDQLWYYGGWCAVGLTASVSALVLPPTMKSNAKSRLTNFMAAGFAAGVLTMFGIATLQFANWIAKIRR